LVNTMTWGNRGEGGWDGIAAETKLTFGDLDLPPLQPKYVEDIRKCRLNVPKFGPTSLSSTYQAAAIRMSLN
jgi:hypothetical protein